MKRATVIACLLLAGCASGTGAKFWAPATWFSHAPADRVDRTETREENAKAAAVKAAQKATHETKTALAAAPASRPVAVAQQSNDSAVVLLDQAAGPLTAEEAAKLHRTVAGLLSENADVRASAERDRAQTQQQVAGLSADLAKAQAAHSAATEKLRAAFDRENALANELRAQRAFLWILGALALVLAIAWIYARYALGGIPGAMAKGLAALRAKGVIPPADQPNDFDPFLNRHEQDLIAKHSR